MLSDWFYSILKSIHYLSVTEKILTMKKIFYSIALVSAMIFTACTEDRGTTTEVVEANDDENVDPSTINDYERVGTAETNASTDYTDATYQQHAKLVSDELSTDLELDNLTATKITKLYYERNRQLDELNRGASRSINGQTDGTGTTETAQGNNTGTMDRARIDENMERELKTMLTPEQYRKYEQNRDKYNNMQMNNTTGTNTDRGTGNDRPTGNNQ